ncbi:uncharacterized protein [Haliotis asinina]|uniref:uncharacterized protein n=1 Tax=Haliotis asinina TaxID=109174 RepID=UPI0035319647
MAEASETSAVSGQAVAVGDHNNITVVHHSIPQLPQNLPAGTRINVNYSIVVGAESGAAASAAEDQAHPQPRPNQQETGQRLTADVRRSRPSGAHCQGQGKSTVSQQVPRQAAVPDRGQGHLDTGQSRPPFDQRANNDGLPYNLYPMGVPGSGPEAMTSSRRPAGRTFSSPIQETVTHEAPSPFVRANTFPKAETPVKTIYHRSESEASRPCPYSLSPQDCPQQANTQQPAPRCPLPKSTMSPTTLTPINTRTAQDAHTPDLTDILVMKVADAKFAVVLDMANKSIKSVSLSDRSVKSLDLKAIPVSFAALDDQKVIVSFMDMKTLSIIDVNRMEEVSTLPTPRQYCGVAVMDSWKVAACCQETQSVEVISVQGQLLKTFQLGSTQHPSAVQVFSTITVSDWQSNTLVCLSRDGHEVFSVRLADSCRSRLRGIAHHGSDILVADEGANRVLSFDSTGQSVSVLLDGGDSVTKPCGLCVQEHTLYIAQADGIVKYWKIPEAEVLSTRM